MFSRRVVLSTTFLAIAASGLTGCGSDDPNEDGHFYCTDSNGTVIDEDYCDDSDPNSSGYFFMYMGSSMHAPPTGYSSYPVGSRLPTGAQKFSVTDKAARAKYGLQPTGKITNGTVKTGVVGKGGPGSTAKVGSSGGGKSGGG